jgi:glycerophosphoryl diester phosphodiesterase
MGGLFGGVLLACVLVGAGADVELIAHRGESADAPENTLAAFRLAWERKADAIELDVHLTRDGELVVCHDPDTKRTTGVALTIKQSTAEGLRKLDAGRWKGARWAGERMPLLGEALATIPDGARCFIEVKVGPESVPALVKAVRASGKRPEQLVVISFHAATVAEAKRRLPELKAYYLASFEKDKETGAWTPTADALIARAKALGADGLDLSAKGPIDRAFVDRVKQAGLGLFVWTIDDPAQARRLAEAGVDGITTNRAGKLARGLREGAAVPAAASRR